MEQYRYVIQWCALVACGSLAVFNIWAPLAFYVSTILLDILFELKKGS